MKKSLFFEQVALAFLVAHGAAQAASPALATIHSFAGGPGDGAAPVARVAMRQGVLYGTTSSGGSTSIWGTVFSLSPPPTPGGSWTEQLLYSFTGGKDGGEPWGKLLIATDGTLIGTTLIGGTAGSGTVFALSPPATTGGQWTEHVIHHFGVRTGDGQLPVGSLVESGGVMYGATIGGGTTGNGTVFSLAPPAAPGQGFSETVIYSFQGGAAGSTPASLVAGSGGILYGTTSYGGDGACTSGCGTVFSLTPPASPGGTWTYQILHSFQATGGDGISPYDLIVGSGGVLYGSSRNGGAGQCVNGCGTVFSLTPPATPGGAWTEQVLHAFSGLDGADISSVLQLPGQGILLGTSQAGGLRGFGNIFALATPSTPGAPWPYKGLYDFTGAATDGSSPAALSEIGGSFYGTTIGFASSPFGTVFQFTP